MPRRRPPEIPRGPDELAEGEYDPTARGNTKIEYRASGRELYTPAKPTVPLPNVSLPVPLMKSWKLLSSTGRVEAPNVPTFTLELGPKRMWCRRREAIRRRN